MPVTSRNSNAHEGLGRGSRAAASCAPAGRYSSPGCAKPTQYDQCGAGGDRLTVAEGSFRLDERSLCRTCLARLPRTATAY
jgi:hypothetical protein